MPEKLAGDPADGENLLTAGPVRDLFEAIASIADNIRLQTDDLKTISAAMFAVAKVVEEDFDERPVERAVDRHLGEERRLREARAAPAQGWSGS
ncbi:hypothetical protein [Methylobacterium planeticum]|uniref:Uncharacterized protein n=1 Tax=Methylobacterium planeticum TaxID=2615211 RepID=A0A6N6N020_9HYPH|nr:hypothetical protein [Methylobacterium planeticum]KAB1075345.1 hypothetical protein F6X51_05550 [Methylobacterium planeticum]